MGFAMVGFYLPLTIYLQSVLGLSAIAAGLTIAPQPLAMMITSGFSAALVGRVNVKWLLMPGLLLFAAGMGYIVFAAHADRRALGLAARAWSPPGSASASSGRPCSASPPGTSAHGWAGWPRASSAPSRSWAPCSARRSSARCSSTRWSPSSTTIPTPPPSPPHFAPRRCCRSAAMAFAAAACLAVRSRAAGNDEASAVEEPEAVAV